MPQILTRGRAISDGSSSYGRHLSRSGALHDHLIFIGRLRSFAILATRGAFWCVRSPSCRRQRIARSTAIVRITTAWISIQRRRQIVEELNDRGPIEPRSQRDRAAIGGLTWGNRCQSIRRRSTDGQDHDRGPIVAEMVAIWSKFEVKFTANMGASSSPQGSALTTMQNRSHYHLYRPRFRANFPL